MGSDSDLKVMCKAADMLEEIGIEYEITIISAHRQPDALIEWARGAEARDVKVMIAGAGMAAALPGMCAALFALPVIGVPLSGKNLDGMDAVFSIMQMPPGVPVATVAIDGAKNAAILAAKILAASDETILEKIKAYTADMKSQVEAKDAKLQKILVINDKLRRKGWPRQLFFVILRCQTSHLLWTNCFFSTHTPLSTGPIMLLLRTHASTRRA